MVRRIRRSTTTTRPPSLRTRHDDAVDRQWLRGSIYLPDVVPDRMQRKWWVDSLFVNWILWYFGNSAAGARELKAIPKKKINEGIREVTPSQQRNQYIQKVMVMDSSVIGETLHWVFTPTKNVRSWYWRTKKTRPSTCHSERQNNLSQKLPHQCAYDT